MKRQEKKRAVKHEAHSASDKIERKRKREREREREKDRVMEGRE